MPLSSCSSRCCSLTALRQRRLNSLQSSARLAEGLRQMLRQPQRRAAGRKRIPRAQAHAKKRVARGRGCRFRASLPTSAACAGCTPSRSREDHDELGREHRGQDERLAQERDAAAERVFEDAREPAHVAHRLGQRPLRPAAESPPRRTRARRAACRVRGRAHRR